MNIENLLNAKKSAEYLGLKQRTQFFPLQEKYNLQPAARMGNMWLYAISDLKKIKKAIKND